jgi:hypothetical protein
MLTTVTITGADDAVDSKALLALSNAFPFVEWGILFSVRRQGTPRYPSEAWRERLVRVFRDDLPLSLHLCGQAAHVTLAGDPSWAEEEGQGFRRIQVNGYKVPGRGTSPGLLRVTREAGNVFTWILQVPDDRSLADAAVDARGLGDAAILFDPSGGRGLEAKTWPPSPHGVSMGFAGGITPDNVEDVLRAIGPRAEDFWIDMESGVRTDDAFDLAKVRRVLETTERYITKKKETT